MEKLNSIISGVFLLAFLGLLFYGLTQYMDFRKEDILNQKRLACGQLYRYTEKLPNGAEASYPMEKEYQSCLKS